MRLFEAAGKIWGSAPVRARDIYHGLPLPLRRAFNRALLPDRAQVVTVQAGLLQGAQMELSPRLESGFYFGSHEPDLQAALPNVVRSGMIAYNLGANLGFFALALSRLVGPHGKVVAFEPDPRVLPRLQSNLALNVFAENVEVFPIAAGERDGEAQFSIGLTEFQGRFADLPYVPAAGATVAVACRALDSFVADGHPKPDLLLMDVEHAEGRVLAGMQFILSEVRPVLIIEMHGPEAIAAAWSQLQRHSYDLYCLPKMEFADAPDQIVQLAHYLARPRDTANA